MFRAYSPCLIETLHPLIRTSFLSLPHPLVTTIADSGSINLTILDTSYKWNHEYLSFCDWLILLINEVKSKLWNGRKH
jgi:hypothetical protein